MASIFLGAATALIVILIGGGAFYVGYKVGRNNTQIPTERENTNKDLTEEQKRVAEGFSNMLNYANRHNKGGDNK